MNFIEQYTAPLQHLSSDACFQDAVVGEGCVCPSDEAIFPIPRTLAMAKEAEIERSFAVDAVEFSLLLLLDVSMKRGRSRMNTCTQVMARSYEGGDSSSLEQRQRCLR